MAVIFLTSAFDYSVDIVTTNPCNVLLTFLEQACTLARRTAETFIKYVHRSMYALGMQVTRNPEVQVRGNLLAHGFFFFVEIHVYT